MVVTVALGFGACSCCLCCVVCCCVQRSCAFPGCVGCCSYCACVLGLGFVVCFGFLALGFAAIVFIVLMGLRCGFDVCCCIKLFWGVLCCLVSLLLGVWRILYFVVLLLCGCYVAVCFDLVVASIGS